MSELHQLSISEQAARLRAKELSAAELCDHYLARIDRLDGELGSFLLVDHEGARRKAATIDEARARGDELGPLAGIPVALKDLLVTQGLATTAASKILEGWIPPYQGTAVAKLDKAGAVMLGKLNLDEFAMGSSSEHSAYKSCKNPWNTSCVPGGSSGGSAAAVAAELCAASLGTDTGGSIRQPAAFCGTTGIKPTYGRVSRYGLIAFASSLDQIGPLARHAQDAALLLEAISGKDPRDATSLDLPVPRFSEACATSAKGLRIGIPAEMRPESASPDVAAAVQGALDKLVELGAELVNIELPHTKYALPTYYLLATAEASSNLSRYDGVRYGKRAEGDLDLGAMYEESRGQGFGSEVKRRIMLGTFALRAGYYDAYYKKAQQVRTLIRDDFRAAFDKVDVIASPTTPTVAFEAGSKADGIEMYMSDIYTLSCNLAGLPGMSLPCGCGEGGLPVGLQLLAPPLEEERLFTVAGHLQRESDWHLQRPEAFQ